MFGLVSRKCCGAAAAWDQLAKSISARLQFPAVLAVVAYTIQRLL
jgi:hypothetical protein